MRHRGRRHAVDQEVEQAAPGGTVHRPPGANSPSTRSSVEDQVLGLQHSAGNQAVAQALAANKGGSPAGQASAVAGTLTTAQREAAEAAPSPSLGPQFAAIWQAEVIVPLGRVTFLVEESSAGALRRLVQALETILKVLSATPREDPNWHRVQLLGRMVNALIDLVSVQGGVVATDADILADMIIWRSRAVELEPLIRHAPRTSGGDEPPAQVWHELVVLPLGRAQVRLEHSPAEAVQGYLHALEGILLTLRDTPRTDPVRLRISSLSVAVQGMLDRLEARTGLGSPDATARAIQAFEAAEALGARLAGKPAPTTPGGAKQGGAKQGDVEPDGTEQTAEEPKFTWERQGGHTLDLENLERP